MRFTSYKTGPANRNRRANCFVAVVTIVGLLSLAANLRGQDPQQTLPSPNGHINDFAGVADSATRQRLETILVNLEDRTGIDFVVATVKTVGSADIYDYSLRVANDWAVGSRTSSRKSVLLFVAADSARFFTQISSTAERDLPDGLIGEMGRRMRPQFQSGDFSSGLLAGIRTFVSILGERKDFTFEALDQKPAEGSVPTGSRRRRVASAEPSSADIASAQPTQIQPSPTQAPEPTATVQPSAEIASTRRRVISTPSPVTPPVISSVNIATPPPSEVVTAPPRESGIPLPPGSLSPSEITSPTPGETPTPVATPLPSETPVVVPTPEVKQPPSPESTASSPPASASPQLNETPAPTGVQSPENLGAQPSPSATPVADIIASNRPRRRVEPPKPVDTPAKANTPKSPSRSPSLSSSPEAPPAPNPDDEKEEVELVLTLPVEQRIDVLRAFIAAHPQSVAVPRANELIVAAHATMGDKKLHAGDVDGGLQEFHRAIAEAPPDMSDSLFTEVIARIPIDLFLRDQRAAAREVAIQVEALAKQSANRLLALEEFYLSIEDPVEATRIAEAAIQLAPEMSAAHQALGAALHIALRLDEAEKEYARALELDQKSAPARRGLADLRRAAGKPQEALALYRELTAGDAKDKAARAGLVLSLLETGNKEEADRELDAAMKDKEQSKNLPLLVGAAYWFAAHGDAARALDFAHRATEIEPRYSWAQIALARALVANKHPLDAERSLRFVRQYGRFATLDYELATVLASVGLYDEAAVELSRSFSLRDGQIETKLAGRLPAHADNFIELLGLERRAAIFQPKSADTEANAHVLKSLLAFNATIRPPEGQAPREDAVLAAARDFAAGDDSMRVYRQIYVADKLVKRGLALSNVIPLLDAASTGVEAAVTIPAATVAVQAEELGDIRAHALAQGATPDIPDAPTSALTSLLRGHIEDLAGQALFNQSNPTEAVVRLHRAVSVLPEGTPLWRAALWHLGAALEASGKNDQALLSYIKSYVAGGPDPVHRAVIESVYKKVNGTLEGLDDKIGPAVTAANPTPGSKP
jgi:tetratricopeptide (TPR) repeat protein